VTIGFFWFGSSERQVEVNSQGMLEQVRDVVKIATVEGQFSEIYDYKDFYYYDWNPFRKKALIKVSATVSMGFDVSNVEIEVNEQEKEIRIVGLPPPSILSRDIEHEYYDIQEGSFNAFQPKDFNKMQKDIRKLIEGRVLRSELPQIAGDRLETLIQGLHQLVKPYGWRIRILDSVEPTSPLEELLLPLD
jgi:hypothetical protein